MREREKEREKRERDRRTNLKREDDEYVIPISPLKRRVLVKRRDV